MAAIPPKWYLAHNIPSDLFTLYFKGWYPYTGRFDILTIAYFWGMARLFGDNGDVWRLAGTLSVSLAIALFYLMAIKLRISRGVAWFLALSLFFAPIGWLRGIEAELRAVFFLMLALYLSLASDRWWNTILSAIALAAAVLTKETFLGAWILIPIMIVLRKRRVPDAPTSRLFPSLLKQLVPHFVAGALVLAFIAYVRATIPVQVDYVFQSSATSTPMSVFVSEAIRALQPDLTVLNQIPWDKAVIILLMAAVCIRLFWRAQYAVWFNDWDTRFALLVAGLLVALFLHAIPFYITSRSIEGRYIAPANFFAALLIGLVGTPFVRMVVHGAFFPVMAGVFNRPAAKSLVANLSLLAVTIVALGHPLDSLMMETAQYRADMTAWGALNDLVAKTAPPHAHVVAFFPSPSMGETDALMVNLLLRGRYDITYHVGDFPDAACQAMPEYCQSYEDFNALQPPLPQGAGGPVLYVNVASGDSQRADLPSSLRKTLRLLFRSPGGYLRLRYIEGYRPYIEYNVSIHQ